MAQSHWIPDASVNRLPVYLRALVDMAEAGTHTVSSEALAAASAVNSAKVRKDLSYLGSYGTRGVGYDVDYLIHQVSRELGLTRAWSVCLVGVGNLGQALARYGGFPQRGFRIAALFDTDPEKVGRVVAGLEVHHVDEVERLAKEHEIAIGVLTVPGAAAQEVADRLVAAGISSILNFAPTVLRVPDSVGVRRVDLSTELQILSFYEQRRAAEEEVRHGTARRRLEDAEGRLEDAEGRTRPEAEGQTRVDDAADLEAQARVDDAADLEAQTRADDAADLEAQARVDDAADPTDWTP